jgi:hypothetical protein
LRGGAAGPQDAPMAGDRRTRTGAAQWLACTFNAGLLAGAVGVVAA